VIYAFLLIDNKCRLVMNYITKPLKRFVLNKPTT